MSYFAKFARCLAWDAPGYGDSTPLGAAAPQPAAYADALLSFLDALQLQNILLVAHSLGAMMATAFAAQEPHRIQGMVLLDPAKGYGDEPPAVAKAKLTARLGQLESLGIEGLAATRASALVSPGASPQAIDLVRWNMRRLKPKGYLQAARMLCVASLLKDAQRFPGNVLIASGTADTITPPEACRRVASAFPRGTYSSLPGLGHAGYIENPAMVNEHLNDFRKRTRHE